MSLGLSGSQVVSRSAALAVVATPTAKLALPPCANRNARTRFFERHECYIHLLKQPRVVETSWIHKRCLVLCVCVSWGRGGTRQRKAVRKGRGRALPINTVNQRQQSNPNVDTTLPDPHHYY